MSCWHYRVQTEELGCMQVTCEALTALDFDFQPILPHPFLQKLSIYLVDCCALV